MSEEHPRLAVLVGSAREGRFGPTVANWFADQARQHNSMETELIDLAETPLPVTLTSHPDPGVTEMLDRLSPRLESADAFVVVTPEYNHSFPAVLKSAIDWHYTQWRAKPVGFVSYGGMSGGLRAVEQLRLVFAEMHAVTVRDGVSFHMAWEKFDQDGSPVDPTSNAAAKTMLDQLTWWARALRTARTHHPYTT
ncbi:NADPH-dependent FMN reductase [Actinopolyspora mortivallis]|uniref:NADPH-dependent FMN reductase n=1 Tax=Actinopolyspora mortivallis TaxID=33906 RepID=A0A2T0GWY6_ACTMO|nr:NAD(P)H-dependent oxidoreductase [Actinopolyspora mortivallis]PRW63626.1 NADPH-dependent FMN reductase [Actinopolyspora mortivallis]